MHESTASKMTTEHLGRDATDEDLELFRTLVSDLMRRDNLSEQDATDAMWGNGNWWSAAKRLGLA